MDLREMPSRSPSRNPNGPRVRHPWEESRALFFRARLAPFLVPGVTVVDIGAGDGYLASCLLDAAQPGGTVTCFDPCYTPEQIVTLTQEARPGLTYTERRPTSQFDVVLALDVIEHVSDDRAFLDGIVNDMLRPGGVLLVSVPAHPSLFTRHDVSLGHYRRYRLRQLRRLMRDVGLVVEISGGLFHSLLPLRVGQKSREILQGVRARADPGAAPERVATALTDWHGGHSMTRMLLTILRLDNCLSAICARFKLGLPGLSVWALTKKP